MKPGDRYKKIVEWSEEDQCYIGRCPELMLGGVHGSNEAIVYQELCDAIDEWIQIYIDDNEQLPPSTLKMEYSTRLNQAVVK